MIGPDHDDRSTAPALRTRRGLTLVELLVTMAIVAILASTVVFAMASASESAKAAKTRTTIAKLHALLMERWESYETRRVPFRTPPANMAPARRQRAEMQGMRELMLIELPDRWSDVAQDPANPNDPGRTLSLIRRTGLAEAYLRRFRARRSFQANDLFQGAECLYLIISLATGDGEAMEQFADSDIGDVDGDGAFEFLDGWGNPIGFIRWPAYFESELQSFDLQAFQSTGQAGNPQEDHDPFDPFNADPKAYRLVPLIYSAGPDGEARINNAPGFRYDPPIDPYNATAQIGKINDRSAAADNIHNHLIGRF